ncbi:MAG: MarR family transcriptional regulator [Sphingobacteriia bacterium]|nr:MarR family transcriptional regulator [Sphingobacteriia bacterium]
MQSEEFSFGRCISILYRFGQGYVGKKLEEYNIGSGQYPLLLTLSRHNGISQEELAGYLKIDKGSIAKSVKKLEDDAYIKKSIDCDDKRAYKVFLTQKALDIMPLVEKAIKDWEGIIVSDLSDNEKQVMEQLLCKMASKSCHTRVNNEV